MNRSEVLPKTMSGRTKQSVYAPILKKLENLEGDNALILNFGKQDFLKTRGYGLRLLINRMGRRLHLRKIDSTSYALWTSEKKTKTNDV